MGVIVLGKKMGKKITFLITRSLIPRISNVQCNQVFQVIERLNRVTQEGRVMGMYISVGAERVRKEIIIANIHLCKMYMLFMM